MPTDQIPGFLSRAISQQLRRCCKASGLVKDVEMHLKTEAMQRNDKDLMKQYEKKCINASTPKHQHLKAQQTPQYEQQYNK